MGKRLNWVWEFKIIWRLLGLLNLGIAIFIFAIIPLGFHSGMTSADVYIAYAIPLPIPIVSLVNVFRPFGGVIPYLAPVEFCLVN